MRIADAVVCRSLYKKHIAQGERHLSSAVGDATWKPRTADSGGPSSPTLIHALCSRLLHFPNNKGKSCVVGFAREAATCCVHLRAHCVADLPVILTWHHPEAVSVCRAGCIARRGTAVLPAHTLVMMKIDPRCPTRTHDSRWMQWHPERSFSSG